MDAASTCTMRTPLFLAACTFIMAAVTASACSEVEDSLDAVPPGPRRVVSSNEPRPVDASVDADASIDATPEEDPADLFVDPAAGTQKR